MAADRHPVRAFCKSRAIVAACATALGISALVPTHGATQQKAAAAQVDVQERARLLELQRKAVAQLQQSTRDGASADQVRQALLDASRSLEALGTDPPPPPPSGPPAIAPLDASLRAELRRASAEITALASGDLRRVSSSTGPVLTLLERVRSQLEGEIALGLTFQGSYSQSKPKEPAYGGHASAMGPAPANCAVGGRRRPRAGDI